MAVASIQNNQSAINDIVNGTAGQKAAPGSTQEVQERFLKLLVTQLQNQDPMNPMDNAQMTMQLAQLSTVEGINNMNGSLGSMLEGIRSSQTMQAASLIGRQVFVDGSELTLSGGLGGGGADLDAPADSVNVKIFDENGQVVRTLQLGQQPAGLARFVWDGKDLAGNQLPDGYYQFTVEALQDGETVNNTALTVAKVSSVVTQDGELKIELYGQGDRTLNQVRQIF